MVSYSQQGEQLSSSTGDFSSEQEIPSLSPPSEHSAGESGPLLFTLLVLLIVVIIVSYMFHL